MTTTEFYDWSDIMDSLKDGIIEFLYIVTKKDSKNVVFAGIMANEAHRTYNDVPDADEILEVDLDREDVKDREFTEEESQAYFAEWVEGHRHLARSAKDSLEI